MPCPQGSCVYVIYSFSPTESLNLSKGYKNRNRPAFGPVLEGFWSMIGLVFYTFQSFVTVVLMLKIMWKTCTHICNEYTLDMLAYASIIFEGSFFITLQLDLIKQIAQKRTKRGPKAAVVHWYLHLLLPLSCQKWPITGK